MEIVLTEPPHESLTAPLQRFCWPCAGDEGMAGAAATPIIWDRLTEVAPDRTVPRPVCFAWEPVPAEGVRYDLQVATAPSFAGARCLAGLTEPHAEVWHLHLGTRYYWRVTAMQAGQVLGISPTWAFTTHQAPPRWIHVPGMTNVRDMGGWPLRDGGQVRQGLIYRTSEMNSHLQITEEGKRVLLEELGIRTDVDLRGAQSREGADVERAWPALDTQRVRWVHLPTRPYAAIREESPYGQPAYRAFFRLLADPAHYPLIFHCWGGADRVGTLAFLLGALLGMRLDHLIMDYEFTSLSVWGPRSRASAEFTGLMHALNAYGDPGDIQSQVEGYLCDIGVTQEEMAAIREQLVDG